MPSPSPESRSARPLVLLVAALLALLALAPGQAAADAQNRVGAFSAAPSRTPATAAESSCTPPGSTVSTGRIAAVIGEDMQGRVIPEARRRGADYYDVPPAGPAYGPQPALDQ